MNENNPCPMVLIGRCTSIGALMGLVVGAIEGVYRYRYPSPSVLLRPNVSYVILFLGPLLDALVGGFFGMVTGLFVASRRSRILRSVSRGVGVCLVAMLVLVIAKHPGYAVAILMGTYPTPFTLAMRAGILLAASGTFVMGRLLPLRTLSVPLAAVWVVLLVGVGTYALRPAMHRMDIAAKPPGPIGEPNIILITLDTVRADHLSLYGYPSRTTPRIDKWARQGVVFENAIASTSWTLASHASIFTGLLPHQHGANFTVPADPSWWTLGDVLSLRGFETAGFTSNLQYGGIGWGMGSGFELYDDDSTSVRHNLKSLLLGRNLLQPFYGKYVQPDDMDRRDAGQINRDVLHWFHHRSRRPFYLFINYFDAHDPYLVPAHPASRFGLVFPLLFDRIESVFGMGDSHRDPSAEATDSPAGYDNCLAFLDSSVGELLDSLSRLPGWENTIVIITSDHGEAFGEHGTYDHVSNLYREVLHVPLIVMGPAIPSGLRVSHVVPIQEIFETVLQFAGMNNPQFQRASLQRFWGPEYKPGDLEEFVVSEIAPEKTYPTSISLTTPEWQYLHDARGNEELYRWVSDPGEHFNVAKSPEYQEVLRDLQIKLRMAVTDSLHPWKGPEYLSALGGPDSTLANAARAGSRTDTSPDHSPRIPIGTAQAFFPRRSSTSTRQPLSTDQELLQSLPYH